MRPTFVYEHYQQRFARDGYVQVPFLDTSEVEALRDLYLRLGRSPGDRARGCVSTFEIDDPAYKAAVREGVATVLRPHLDVLFDRQRALPASFLVKWPGDDSDMPLHQDTTLVDEAEHRSAEIWVALEDTSEENGQLWMVPGSHRWVPSLRGIPPLPSPFDGVEPRIKERHAVPVPLQAGEAIVFDHACLHFSYPNRTPHERLVAIIDVLPEEARQLHYFGHPDGTIEAYEIDESFWIDNTPATLGTPPPASQSVGAVDFEVVPLTDARLDELVANGGAIDRRCC